MPKTPVLIAAYNEEAYIGRTLDHLPADNVEPIVIVNGSTDATADIARSFGVTTIEREEAGKLPAIQEGLRYLGDKALDPVLFIDADAYPVFPKTWAGVMRQAVEATEPRGAVGTVSYIDGSPVINVLRTANRYRWYAKRRIAGVAPDLVGMNMALNIHNREVLESILAMPHYWPGEDRALGDQIVLFGGSNSSVLDIRSTVRASARYHIPIGQRLRMSREETNIVHDEGYLNRAAEGSIDYSLEISDSLKASENLQN